MIPKQIGYKILTMNDVLLILFIQIEIHLSYSAIKLLFILHIVCIIVIVEILENQIYHFVAYSIVSLSILWSGCQNFLHLESRIG